MNPSAGIQNAEGEVAFGLPFNHVHDSMTTRIPSPAAFAEPLLPRFQRPNLLQRGITPAHAILAVEGLVSCFAARQGFPQGLQRSAQCRQVRFRQRQDAGRLQKFTASIHQVTQRLR